MSDNEIVLDLHDGYWQEILTLKPSDVERVAYNAAAVSTEVTFKEGIGVFGGLPSVRVAHAMAVCGGTQTGLSKILVKGTVDQVKAKLNL